MNWRNNGGSNSNVPSGGIIVASNKFSMTCGINDYPGTSNDLQGCVNDAIGWADVLIKRGFKNVLLKDSQVTREAFVQTFGNYVADAKSGASIVITNSSHGTSLPDTNNDEPDGKDEALCMYNGYLRDDDIRGIIKNLADGVNLTIISDSCLSGDTKIPLLDGTTPTIKELSERDEHFWVYSCSPDGDIVAGEGHSARKTKTAEIISIELDNGEIIECTDDHLIMVRNGTYKKAGDLINGESLMPFNRRVGEKSNNRYLIGYEMIKNPKTDKWIPTHLMVRDSLSLKEEGSLKTICHHRNFNKRDNNPKNLIMTTWDEHKKMHGEVGRRNLLKTWESPEFRKWRNSDEYKKEQSKRLKGKWKDAEWAKKHIESNRKRFERDGLPEKFVAYNFSQENKENVKKMHQKGGVLYDIVRSKESIENLLKHNNDPEKMKNKIEKRKKHFSDSNSKLYKSMRTPERIETLKMISQYNKYLRANKKNKTEYTFCQWKKDKIEAKNHKVVSIIRTNKIIDVYDLTVEKYHNFAVEAGIFVHNCFSGTVTRAFLNSIRNSNPPVPRFMPPPDNVDAARLGILPVKNRMFYSEEDMKEILISGCNDNEYSYDAYFGGSYHGAMSYFAQKIINENGPLTYKQFYDKLRSNLPQNFYPQTPQLEGKDENKNKIMFA